MKKTEKQRPDAKRVKRLNRALIGRNIDALILRLPENITAFGGYYPLTGMNFLVFPCEEKPILFIPESEQDEAAEGWWRNIETYRFGVLDAADPYEEISRFLKSIISSRGKSWRRIGYEGSFESLAPALLNGENLYPSQKTWQMLADVCGKRQLVDCTDILYQERTVKTPREIGMLERVNRIAGAGLAEFRKTAVPGRTEAEIAGLVTAAVMKKGPSFNGRRIQAYPQISSGSDHTTRAWRPCVISGSRKLKNGDLVMLELGVVADGFWADNTRTVVAGRASARQKEVFTVVASAQAAARKKAGAGALCGDVDAAARSIIKKAGLGKYFIHVTGHGVGFSYHEPFPILAPGNKKRLCAGMVFSVEPGVYIPEFGGIRIEDNVAITPEGPRTLTTFERNL